MRSYMTQNRFAPKNTCIWYYTCEVHFSNTDIDYSKLSVFTINHHKNFSKEIKVLKKTYDYFNDIFYRLNIKNKTNLFLSYEKAS